MRLEERCLMAYHSFGFTRKDPSRERRNNPAAVGKFLHTGGKRRIVANNGEKNDRENRVIVIQPRIRLTGLGSQSQSTGTAL
jgi:hypothetical protein